MGGIAYLAFSQYPDYLYEWYAVEFCRSAGSEGMALLLTKRSVTSCKNYDGLGSGTLFIFIKV